MYQTVYLPIQNEDPKYLFPSGNQPLNIVSSNWQHKFLYYKSVKLDVLYKQIEYEHSAILSNLKSCQFAPKIVVFNLCICCQFEDSQIISPKIIPMSHRNLYL